jgi:hypothetical protein
MLISKQLHIFLGVVVLVIVSMVVRFTVYNTTTCTCILEVRYDNVTLIPLVLQLRLRMGPIQRMGAN